MAESMSKSKLKRQNRKAKGERLEGALDLERRQRHSAERNVVIWKKAMLLRKLVCVVM